MTYDGTVRWVLVAFALILTFVWIVLNTYSFRERFRLLLSPKRLIAQISPGLIFLPQILSPVFFPLPLGNAKGVVIFCGLIIYIGGAALAIWARITMGKSWGMPAQHDVHKQKELVTSGPFAFSRNPIYVGFLVMLVGYELALGSLLVVLVLPPYLLIRHGVLIEEKNLEKYFGKKYLDYKSKTPRFI